MSITNNTKVSDEQLLSFRDALKQISPTVRAWQIRDELKKLNVDLDESTIRGRFIEMGQPLSGVNVGDIRVKTQVPPPVALTPKAQLVKKTYTVSADMQKYIPAEADFVNYIVRDVDKRLALAYDISRPGFWKYPISQGKQGTGKTFGHMYYAYSRKLPFFLFSGYEDFKLAKLFGDKTIVNGSVMFQEGLFTKAIQVPSVILFDEVNAISNQNTFDFHALLQNRELFVKDADEGRGRVYKLHDDCKIGFAQNPKSAKYIGGNIKASNFLGRCTFITYPEFSMSEIRNALRKKFGNMHKDDVDKFSKFYFECIANIETASIPVDISIRQLNNVVDLWMNGAGLKEAIEDGMISILEAVSQPKTKDSFFRIAQACWKELITNPNEKVAGEKVFANLLIKLGRKRGL